MKRSLCWMLAITTLLVTTTLATHGCSKPCGDVGLECCAMDQCVEPLICRDGTCDLVRRDAGTVVFDAGCGLAGLNCCSGSCSTGLVCRADDRCTRGPDLGSSCAKNSECDERLCLPVEVGTDAGRNVCTAVCADGGVCPSGWQCAPYPGVVQPICVCAATAESCNGLDDDCDGTVDGPAAQDWCAASDAGTCLSGACVP